jgi:hypothetical protein
VATIGAAFLTKAIVLGNLSMKLQIWGTGDSERYRAMAPNYCHWADASIVIYDVPSLDSYQEIANWVHELRENPSNVVAIGLIGNKIDLSAARAVPRRSGAPSRSRTISRCSWRHPRSPGKACLRRSRRSRAQSSGRPYMLDSPLRVAGRKNGPTRNACGEQFRKHVLGFRCVVLNLGGSADPLSSCSPGFGSAASAREQGQVLQGHRNSQGLRLYQQELQYMHYQQWER